MEGMDMDSLAYELQRRTRLAGLVREDLDAMLRNCKMTEETEVEYIYVVLWRRGEGPYEYGTHRACLAKPGQDVGEVRAMLVWGHYNLDIVEGHKDFLKRIADET